jgi:hypothetical protein
MDDVLFREAVFSAGGNLFNIKSKGRGKKLR